MGVSAWSIIVVVLMLGIIVTVHELGHFWVASLLKIKAFEVSIFIGPKLFAWKKNGVEYSIRSIPLGAYVRFTEIDENGDPVESDDPDLLINQKRWKRLLVALAGPFMNLVLGIVIFAGIFCFNGFYIPRIRPAGADTQLAASLDQYPDAAVGDWITHINGHRIYTYMDFYYEVTEGVSEYADMTLTMRSTINDGEEYELHLVPELTTSPRLGITHIDSTDNIYNGWEVVRVLEDQNNGNPVMKVGDFLVAVDGKPVTDEDFEEFFTSYTAGDTMRLSFYRDGELMEADCAKTLITYPNDRGVDIFVCIPKTLEDYGQALRSAALMPVSLGHLTGRLFGSVFEGEEEVYNMVSGPVGFTTVVSDVVDDQQISMADKMLNVLNISGIISLSLVYSNLLPIPGLDGVQVVLIVIEMIIGKPLSKKTETVINIIGFIMLIGLAIFAFTSDIIRIIVGAV